MVASHQFDPEPAKAVTRHIHREQPAVAYLESPVQPDERRENQNVPQQFVQERRMDHFDQLARRDTVQRVERTGDVATLKDLQAPRQRRRPSVQFLIEVVAQPPDRLSQNDSWRDRVTERRQRNALQPARDPRCDAAQRHRAPDAKAAVPDSQRPLKARSVVAKVGPPVRHDVIEPSTDQTEQHGRYGDVVDDPALTAPGLPPPVTDHERHHDAHDDEQRVRPEWHRSQMPDALRGTGNVSQNCRPHAVILCRTPSASSAVSDRTAEIPSFNADTNADPTMTPSA